MPKAYVALGSNLQKPQQQVEKAFIAIEKLPNTKVIKQSSLYQSPPFGYDDQPDFINAVVEIKTDLGAESLMQKLLDLETNFGRERPFANAPRVLDLDLLLYDKMRVHSDFLTLPHPRMHLRSFVLMPLAEIAPKLVLPKHGNVVKLAESLQDQGTQQLKLQS